MRTRPPGFRSLLLILPLLVARAAFAQPFDFGYVPVQTTNTEGPLYYGGGAWDGTNTIMTMESIVGPDAGEFSTSPNYTGQTLDYGQDYPYYISFFPGNTGFASATLTNFEIPSPPFGAGGYGLQGTGMPNSRPGSGPVVPELAPLEQAMTNYLVTHQFEDGAIALMYNDKLVLRQGYGWRDTNFTTVIHPDNLFRLASVSKMLTASAIQQLIDQGKITAATPVYSYLGIPPWGGVLGDSRITNITVQNLLDHTGGWDRNTSPVGDPVFDTIEISTDMGLDYPADPTNVISWMFSKPLDFTPGTTNVYSNFGYQILGRVIEKASGKRYVDYIQQNLLGNAGLTNALGFTNVIQAHSRPTDLAPWEIWYANDPQFLEQSAVDFPDNIFVRDIDGGFYIESFDAFGGMCASAVGLCHYLLNYWEGGDARVPEETYSWFVTFYGSLPGTTTVLYQNINETPASTNGIEYAALFNERDGDTNDNAEADSAIQAAAAEITSWPTNGGGMIQWAVATTNVGKNAGSVTVALSRSGGSSLPVKISYTTYGLTAGSSNFVATNGIISFGAGVTNQNVTVSILNDRVIDPTRSFSLELISASGGAWLGDRLSSIVNITDTNVAPQFTGEPALLPGGKFQAQLKAGIGLIVTVQYSTNFSTWQTLETFTNAVSPVTITDTNAGARGRTYYRAMVP